MEDSSFSRDLTLVLGCNDLKKNRVEFPLTFDKDFRFKSIDELFLKTRASNVLKRRNIFTLGQVLDNFDDLIHFRNCGLDTVKEIKNALLQVWYETLDSDARVAFWEEFIDLNCYKG